MNVYKTNALQIVLVEIAFKTLGSESSILTKLKKLRLAGSRKNLRIIPFYKSTKSLKTNYILGSNF